MARTGMAWYSGDDPLNLAFLAHGAAGVVSVAGHVLGPQLAAMVRYVDAGDLPAARKVYTAMLPVIDAIMGGGIGAVTAKAAVQLLGLIDSRAVRLPQVEATEQEVADLRNALVAAGLLPDN
jgi:4-hydroxy-tetrahydrodipicolinate synthase